MQDKETPSQAQPAPLPRFTWRLTFAYDEKGVRLQHADHVQMVAPGSHGSVPSPGHAGHWLELRGPSAELLYHRVLPPLIERDREVFDNEPGRTMHRVPRRSIHGEFELLVPDVPGAEHLLVHGHGAQAERHQPASLLFRLEMKDLASRRHGRQAS